MSIRTGPGKSKLPAHKISATLVNPATPGSFKRIAGQQTPRRWELGNSAEETFCCPAAFF
jgi:hypothetical protein